ncbi:MAG: hypothetical protein V1781_03105 [Bacteroidota bacterium]
MKKVFLFTYCLLFATYCFSQDFTPPKPSKEKEPFWSKDKIYFGGGLGLLFGTVTFVNVSPIIGYNITKRYSAGLGITYIYFSDRSSIPAYSQNIYGGNIFNRFMLFDFLFAHAEYELLNGDWLYNTERFYINNMWVGGGLCQQSGNSSLCVMVLWNLLDSPYSPIKSPQIRIGLNIGI